MDYIFKYTDTKNKALFDRLSAKYQITLAKYPLKGDGQDEAWPSGFQNGVFRIGHYKDANTTAYFSHELLHLDLIDKGFSDFQVILPEIKTERQQLIFVPIIGHINNIFAHQRLFNDFLKMGYSPSEFVSDYSHPFDFDLVRNAIDNAENRNDGIQYYITSFYTAMDNKNPDKVNGFSEHLNYLKATDSNLFSILENNWQLWVSDHSMNNREVLSALFQNVEVWYNEKFQNGLNNKTA